MEIPDARFHAPYTATGQQAYFSVMRNTNVYTSSAEELYESMRRRCQMLARGPNAQISCVREDEVSSTVTGQIECNECVAMC